MASVEGLESEPEAGASKPEKTVGTEREAPEMEAAGGGEEVAGGEDESAGEDREVAGGEGEVAGEEDEGAGEEDGCADQEDVGAGGEVEGAGGEDEGAGGEDEGAGGEDEGALSAAQRARMQRNLERARALHRARLVHGQRAALAATSGGRASRARARPVDTGGGFLADEAEPPASPARLSAPHAPFVHRAEQPRCERCTRRFPQSYLLDTFGLGVCDACRDDADADSLVARTDAKAEYLLKDCDLDARPPPLRCVRRRNPHSARYGDMRLYLRAQVAARALQVWGSEAALEEERARRLQARARTLHARTHRRLRALRMDVRSSLYRRAERAHEHEFGAETYDPATDQYERSCAECGHSEIYEKM